MASRLNCTTFAGLEDAGTISPQHLHAACITCFEAFTYKLPLFCLMSILPTQHWIVTASQLLAPYRHDCLETCFIAIEQLTTCTIRADTHLM